MIFPIRTLIVVTVFGVVNGAYPGVISTIIMIAMLPVFFGICIVPFVFLFATFLKSHT